MCIRDSPYVVTLLCETLTSAKQAIKDKLPFLQGSVATYLGCSGVVNNQINKVFCLLLSL